MSYQTRELSDLALEASYGQTALRDPSRNSH